MPLIPKKSMKKDEDMPAAGKDLSVAYSVAKHARKKMSSGGMAEPMMDDSIPNSMAEAIMQKRKAKMAEGQADIHSNEMEQPDMFDEANEDALLEDHDATMDGMDQPEDSNMDSMEPGLGEEDEHADDLISRIMNKRKAKI